MINITVICNQAEDRENMVAILTKQNDFHVTGIGADGYDALMAAKNQHPDIIIMDFKTGGLNSTDLAPVIKRNSPSTSLIVLYSCDEFKYTGLALRAGVLGFLQKQKDIKNLTLSVQCVYHGGLYISQSIKTFVLHQLEKSTMDKAIQKEEYLTNNIITENYFSFTDLQIFFGIILGYTDKEIAKKINICTGAVRNSITRVKCKTGLQNRTQMAILALFTIMINRKKFQKAACRFFRNGSY